MGSGQAVLAGLDLEGSASFDWIAELAALSTDYDAAFVALLDQDNVTVIGSYGVALDAFKKTMASRQLNQPIVWSPDVDAAFPASPLVNGTYASAKTWLSAGIYLYGEFVGFIGVFTERRLKAVSQEQERTMVDLAEIAGEMIRTKASLKLILGDVFSLVNR
ncbi:hypothetical protein QQG91_12765 [Marivivens sp. LCG002]|uniref:hypothetical protein n=1 Tax=Marivivens sp. LCG002 TaxID=3051171 RepID=UPI002556BC56|nr:hypothetical protein [Marivivens sp. LCG002]WIV50530.1 hypothetical protein QQG91_12765 [Marivivens sp. LCG002]